jgi:cell division cycle 20-like protein 1 (cofactor of APC complex)
MNPNAEIYSLSPIKRSSQAMLLEPRKQQRAVSKVPYKVLDAPDLADDFYLNLVDWGNQNILGVGLGNCVYMWNSESGRVNKLCELPDDTVTSVGWIQRVSSFRLHRSSSDSHRVHTLQSVRTRDSSRSGTQSRPDD